MQPTAYLRIRLSGIPRDLEDELTGFVFSLGAAGMSEVLQFDQPNLVYDPLIRITDRFDADAFFTERPPADTLQRLQARYPDIRFEASEELTKDWLAEWKKTFKSFQLIGPFWVVPSWEPVASDIKYPIRIDPGMAFGTGTHETTRLAAQHLVSLQSALVGKSVLDVGTGTGILAMIGERLGARPVIGLDIDPEARRTARENLALNSCPVEIPDSSLQEVQQAFDVVIANIIDGVLVTLREDLLRVLKPGGHIILSGILREREQEFTQKFLSHPNLRVQMRSEMNEWCSFLVVKK